jgi:hypothetical protein
MKDVTLPFADDLGECPKCGTPNHKISYRKAGSDDFVQEHLLILALAAALNIAD